MSQSRILNNPGVTARLSSSDLGQSLTVASGVQFSYHVHFGRGFFNAENDLVSDVVGAVPGAVRRPARCLCVVDAGLAAVNPAIVNEISSYLEAHAAFLMLAGPVLVLPGGEAAKNSFEVAHKVIRAAHAAHICRHSFVLAVGGGAFLDAVGFAAALVHRGVRLLRFPTTVLAQNDAGIGVKNGLNLRGVKNFLGTFSPPFAVFNDFDLLETLPARDWIAGIGEAFKVAIIKDAAFLEWLEAHADKLRELDRPAMEYLIRHTAKLHATHISAGGDPFEEGSARPLDFGHWAAHKLETLTCNELRHGEAVAVGIALDLLYAARLGFISAAAAHRIIAAMRRAGLPVWHEAMAAAAGNSGRPFILCGLEEFREHLGGELHVTLPRPLGSKVEVNEMDEDLLRRCLVDLAGFAAATNPESGHART